MSAETAAKEVRRGEVILQSRDQLSSAKQTLNQVKSWISNLRSATVTEFGAGSSQVAELDAFIAEIRANLSAFVAGF